MWLTAENSRYLFSDWLCIIVSVAKCLSCIPLCIWIKIPSQAKIEASQISLFYPFYTYIWSVQLWEQIWVFCVWSPDII